MKVFGGILLFVGVLLGILLPFIEAVSAKAAEVPGT